MNKILKIGLIVVLAVIFPLASNGFAQWRGYEGYGWHMGPGMMGWGSGMGWIWHIIMMAFWIAVIVGIIFLIRWLVVSASAGDRTARSEDSALNILKKRYARGEINREEFEEKKRDLLV